MLISTPSKNDISLKCTYYVQPDAILLKHNSQLTFLAWVATLVNLHIDRERNVTTAQLSAELFSVMHGIANDKVTLFPIGRGSVSTHIAIKIIILHKYNHSSKSIWRN